MSFASTAGRNIIENLRVSRSYFYFTFPGHMQMCVQYGPACLVGGPYFEAVRE